MNNQSLTWPNFFIVGAAKAGTTSMFLYLEQIPEIFMPKIKEPNFFAPNFHDFKSFNAIRKKDEYLKLFRNVKDEKLIGEASPYYLPDPDSAKLIYENSPNAKIIIILRNPVTRTFSNYLHIKQNFNETLPLRQIIDDWEEDPKPRDKFFRRKVCLNLSMYYEDVKRYLDKFGDNQVKIIYFENFIKDPTGTMKSVLDFLGLKYDVTKLKLEKHNAYFEPKGSISRKIITNPLVRNFGKKFVSQTTQTMVLEKYLTKDAPKPKISEEDKQRLQKIFVNDIENLKTIVKEQPPW